MKMKDVEIGQDYAYKGSTLDNTATRVKVLAKGLQYGRSKGRGVRVENLTGHYQGLARIVMATKLTCTWAEWKTRQAEIARIRERAEARRLRMEGIAREMKLELERLGFPVKVVGGQYKANLLIRFSNIALAEGFLTLIATLEVPDDD
jgi:hypothetical protein